MKAFILVKQFARVAVGLVLLAAMASRLDAQTLTVLHTFGATIGITNVDGATPVGSLLLSGNKLYGTTDLGGTNGYGTVYAMNPDGSGFAVLHAFSDGADGAVPQRDLALLGGTLYGLAESGKVGGVSTGFGEVYTVDTNGNNFNVLYTFPDNSNGALGEPNAGLVTDGVMLYGACWQGGNSGSGSIFSVETNGTFHPLHLFNSATDGKNPLGHLLVTNGMIYGTCRNAGPGGSLFGTVFSLSTNGGNFNVLHAFPANPSLDGKQPDAGLILSGNTLYGTTGNGGTNGSGTIFAINTDGSGYTIVHSLNSHTGEGSFPESTLWLRGNTLYGTTQFGGATNSNDGSVYAINTDGSSFTLLHSFSPEPNSTNTDGAKPYGTPVMAGNILYGTASSGGANGAGVVYSLAVVPQITSLQLAGTNLLLSGINALANSTATVLASTNLILPLNQWTPMATNALVSGGNFSFTATNAVIPGQPRQFFRLLEQ